MTTQRIAVIGAGVSGIAAIKSCLEEGLEPVAYEKGTSFGGLWHYTPEEDGMRLSVFDSIIMNTNRFSNVFSDFPNPAREEPLYVGHKKFFAYLNQYVDHFDLRKHVTFGAEVLKVENAEITEKKWKLTWREKGVAGDTSDYFDGVMVCSGFFNTPYIPDIKGLCEFKGRVIHSGYYRTHESLKDKRVLVIGMGNSGTELACGLSDSASEVFLCSDQGAWMLPRIFPLNLPFELMFGSRLVASLMPTAIYMSLMETFSRTLVDSDGLGIQSSEPFGTTVPTACDGFVLKIAYGKVHLRPNVDRVVPTGVQFEDGVELDVDAIVLGTGFDTTFPFLEESLLPFSKDGLPSSYKHMFPTNPANEGLCFVGVIHCAAPTVTLFELQARACAAVLAGRIQLPGQMVMERWVQQENSRFKQQAQNKTCNFPPLPWIPVQDDLAKFLGVQPHPWKTLLTDVQLGKALLLNMPIASAFRLNGPHKWSGARQAVIQAGPDLKLAMSTMYRGQSYGGVLFYKVIKWCIVLVFAFVILVLIFGILLGKYAFR